MSFLLDTCVISNYLSKRPEARVSSWIDDQIVESLYLSVFSIGEIRNGIVRTIPSRRRGELEIWLNRIKTSFGQRILHFEKDTAETWGELTGKCDSLGNKLPIVDSLIAATAIEKELIVATRNVRDFDRTGVQTFNPWEFES